MGSNTRKWLAGSLCLVVLAAASFGVQAQTVFSYSSVSGDWVGGGETRAFTSADAIFSVSASEDSVTISINTSNEYWSIDLRVPKGQKLAPGRHFNAERASFATGRSPGLDVSGGRGCNQIWGSFNIRQVVWNASGLAGFEADFIQHCETPTAPPLAGVIRWKVPQMSLKLDGPLIAQGIEDDYFGDSSLFGMYGNTTQLGYYGSGKRADWSFRIQPPTGKQLAVGRYVTNTEPTSTRAGFAINGLSKCWTYTGTLDIKRITVAPNGDVKALYATFEQRCAGVSGSLLGTIHYGL